MRKIKNISVLAILIMCTAFCFFGADGIKSAVYDALMRCLNVIIPSLYAMMIISGLLVRSGTASSGRIICGLFSMLAGYPVGAKMISAEYAGGKINKKEAEMLSGIFFGAGGAFIFGCTSYGGGVILLSNIAANIILAIVLSAFFGHEKSAGKAHPHIDFSMQALVESVNSAGRSMSEICFAVLAFAVVTEVMRESGAISAAGGIIAALSGFTSEEAERIICAALDITAVGDVESVPVVSGLISFGGLCVFMQISAIFKGRLSMLPLIASRTVAGIISGIICKVLLPFFVEADAVAAFSVTTRLYKSPSPVPSILLIIMTAVLFEEYEKNFQKTLDKPLFL